MIKPEEIEKHENRVRLEAYKVEVAKNGYFVVNGVELYCKLHGIMNGFDLDRAIRAYKQHVEESRRYCEHSILEKEREKEREIKREKEREEIIIENKKRYFITFSCKDEPLVYKYVEMSDELLKRASGALKMECTTDNLKDYRCESKIDIADFRTEVEYNEYESYETFTHYEGDNYFYDRHSIYKCEIEVQENEYAKFLPFAEKEETDINIYKKTVDNKIEIVVDDYFFQNDISILFEKNEDGTWDYDVPGDDDLVNFIKQNLSNILTRIKEDK